MKNPSYSIIRNITGAVLSAVLFSACATTTPPVAQPQREAQKASTPIAAADMYYTVKRGDLLTSIAEQYTGSADNWTTIAETNGVSDPRKLQVGQKLTLPGFLLPATTSSVSATTVPAAVAVKSVNRVKTTRTINSIDDNGPDAADVEVKKANPNKRFVLRPLGADVSGDAVVAETEGNDYIKIIGSYFPKVVYQSPRLNAKLLMRVAPGTTFPLEKLDNGWYQISTDQGPGYLRLQDGQPTDSKG